MTDELLPPKELAPELGVHVNYIYAVKRAMIAEGIGWPAGKQSSRRVRTWLEERPGWTRRSGQKVRG